MLDESQRFEMRPDPLLPYDLRPGRFDNNVQEPSVVVGPAGIELFFIGLGILNPDEPINAPGQAITSVGMGRAFLDDQMNVLQRSVDSVLDGVNIIEVRYLDGIYQLFSTTFGGFAHEGAALSYAWSIDGRDWSTPEVVLASQAPFDAWALTAPTVAVEPGEMVLFYTAYETSGTTCVLSGPGGRFGLPLASDDCLHTTIGRAVAPYPPQP
jgi:hypothetical protein